MRLEERNQNTKRNWKDQEVKIPGTVAVLLLLGDPGWVRVFETEGGQGMCETAPNDRVQWGYHECAVRGSPARGQDPGPPEVHRTGWDAAGAPGGGGEGGSGQLRGPLQRAANPCGVTSLKEATTNLSGGRGELQSEGREQSLGRQTKGRRLRGTTREEVGAGVQPVKRTLKKIHKDVAVNDAKTITVEIWQKKSVKNAEVVVKQVILDT